LTSERSAKRYIFHPRILPKTRIPPIPHLSHHHVIKPTKPPPLYQSPLYSSTLDSVSVYLVSLLERRQN